MIKHNQVSACLQGSLKGIFGNGFGIRGILLVTILPLFFVSCQKELKPATASSALPEKHSKGTTVMESSMHVFATGLNNPRGLKFGPDGNLYVAEGGMGGSHMSTTCAQVVPPVGPYLGSTTGGRISMITPNGQRTTVTESLPSSQTSKKLGSLVSGVADVAFIHDTLYAILAGAGCSHGVESVPNGIVKVNKDGTWSMIANLSAYQMAHPVAHPEPDDFEPDGTWYSMISVRGDLYAVEPNHGEMVRVSPSGDIHRVIDISATQGHIVPTSVAYHGNFFVGNLHPFPVVAGSSNIYKITPSGEIKVWFSGFTTILGVLIDNRDRMYVLENTNASGPGPQPNHGDIIRVSPSGEKTVIASGLSLPTGMTFGPDGNIYVSNLGFGPPIPGLGQIIEVDIKD